MKRKRFCHVLLVMLLFTSVFGVATDTTQGATTTEISIRPASQSVAIDDEITYDVVVESVDNGIESYEFDITVGDSAIAKIVDVSLQGSEPGDTGTSVTWGKNNQSLSVAVASGDHDDGVIASVTIEGESSGGTGLYLSDVVVGDEDFASYSIDSVNDAIVTVEGAGTGDEDGRRKDDTLVSGTTFWTGQNLLFNGSSIVNDIAVANTTQRSFQIREVTESNRIGGLEQTLTLNKNGTRVFETNRLDGEYVLTYNSQVVHIDDRGVGTVVNNKTTQNIRKASWAVQPQALSVKFDEDDLPIQSGETAAIIVDSNRASYVLNISSSKLDSDELKDIFDQPGSNNEIAYVDTNEDVIGISMAGDDTIKASFFDQIGYYEFMFTVADAAATDFAAAQINETNVEITFGGNRVYSEQVGDNITIPIRLQDTERAWVFIGSAETNFLERIELKDDNNDGKIKLMVNTFHVGKQKEQAYHVGEDDELVDVTQFAGENATNHVTIPGLSITPQHQLTEPIEAGVYDLRVASNAGIESTAGKAVIEGKEDSGAIDLTDRSTNDIEPLVAPRGRVGSEDFEAVLENATKRNSVATSDRVLFRINASGLYGYLINERTETLFRNGLELLVKQSDTPPNTQSARIDLRSDSTEIYTNATSDTFYVVTNLRTVTTVNNRDIKAGQEYNVSFSIYGGGEELPEYPAGRKDSSPYVETDTVERVSTNIELEEPKVILDGIVDDNLQISAKNDAIISGRTNLAPNSKVTVRLRSTEQYPLRREQTTTVTDEGRFETTFDFSDVPAGVEFEATVYRDATQIESIDGVVSNQVNTSTPSPTVTESLTPITVTKRKTVIVTQSPPPSPTARELTITRTQRVTRIVTKTRRPTASPGQPGFGTRSATIAAFLAILILLYRRR